MDGGIFIMVKREPILSAADGQKIKNSLAEIQSVKTELATASLAGLDVKTLSDRLNESETKLSKLYNAYFPV